MKKPALLSINGRRARRSFLARLDHGCVRLLSRNGRDWTNSFLTVAEAAKRLPAKEALLDDEVAVLCPVGPAAFRPCRTSSRAPAKGSLRTWYSISCIWTAGISPGLEDRKKALRELLESTGAKAEPLRYRDHVIGGGADFFREACRLGMEGPISKRRDAPYRGTRGADWLKIKCLWQQEGLSYTGKVGTGFDARTLRELAKRLGPLERKMSPFVTRPIGVGKPHWVKPELVAEVTFGEWTADGRMRHPSFQGLREVKPATAVVRELPAAMAKAGATRPRSKRWASGRQSGCPGSCSGTRKGAGASSLPAESDSRARRIRRPAGGDRGHARLGQARGETATGTRGGCPGGDAVRTTRESARDAGDRISRTAPR